MDSEKLGITQPAVQQVDLQHISSPLNNSISTLLVFILRIVSFSIITSDIFRDNVLYLFPKTVQGGNVLTAGMLIQALALILLWYTITYALK